MNSFLFSIGVGVEEAPERWKSICGIYARLARGLTRLGHNCRFLVHPDAFDATALAEFEASIGDHTHLEQIIRAEKPDMCFVWGGRIPPDRKTVQILQKNNVKPIFSELGWFPQKGTIYFDGMGTNSEINGALPDKFPALEMVQFDFYRRWASLRIYGRRYQVCVRNNIANKVFVPLQDEADTNITEDSPFKRMDDMLGFLSEQYPTCEFVARIHPKAPPTKISTYPNVTLQDPSHSLYHSLPNFDLVVGINSTVISEAVFLGHSAMCFGDGIAHKFGLARKIDPLSPPDNLTMTRENVTIANSLNYLARHKQLLQGKLSSPSYLKRSYLRDLLEL